MSDKRFFIGQISILLGVITTLLWNSPSAIPFVILFWAIGVYFVMTADSRLGDWMNR